MDKKISPQENSPENKDSVKENDPNHQKKSRIFFSCLMSALIISMIYSVWNKSSHVEEKKPLQEPPIVETNRTVHGEELFDSTVNGKKKRRNRQANEQTTAAAGSNNSETTSEDTTESEWKKRERERALSARNSSFKLKSSASSPSHKKTFFKDEIADIDKQLALIDQKNSTQKNRNGSPYSSDIQEKIVIGRPLSESSPRSGQKKIATGTIISGVLDQDLTSDYVGSYRGRISHDVYDISGMHILIPKGSLYTGKSLRISNVNEPIQARMGMTVNWVVLPNGKRISFEKAAALDQAGVHGIKDRVNHHFLAQFLGVAAYALVSSESSRAGSGIGNDSTFQGELGAGVRNQFSSFANKYLTLVPTITLRAGKPMKIFIEDDIYVSAWTDTYDSFFTKN